MHVQQQWYTPSVLRGPCHALQNWGISFFPFLLCVVSSCKFKPLFLVILAPTFALLTVAKRTSISARPQCRSVWSGQSMGCELTARWPRQGRLPSGSVGAMHRKQLGTEHLYTSNIHTGLQINLQKLDCVSLSKCMDYPKSNESKQFLISKSNSYGEWYVEIEIKGWKLILWAYSFNRLINYVYVVEGISTSEGVRKNNVHGKLDVSIRYRCGIIISC